MSIMGRIIYVAPRARRLRRSPFRMDSAYGEAALAASVIGDAVNDYCCGKKQDSEAARLFFMSDDFDHWRSLLGLPDDLMPEAIRDRVVYLED